MTEGKKAKAPPPQDTTRYRVGKEAVFTGSAGGTGDLPPVDGVEYCVMGRSNVGKSSFINHALESGAISRVSKKPGKTSLANFFRVEDGMYWVDLPGYGYARASGSEKLRWSKLIANYIENRENLKGVIWLIDVRHSPQQADKEAFHWFMEIGVSIFPVFTKCDKLNQKELNLQTRLLTEAYGFHERPVTYSILKHTSRRRFWEAFNSYRAVRENG